MKDKCSCSKTKSFLIAIIAIVAILIVIIGEKPRHTDHIDAQQPKQEHPEVKTNKVDTDKVLNTVGITRSQKDIGINTKNDQPSNQQPQIWPIKQKPSGVKQDSIKPALKKAIDLQSKNPGRYKSQTVFGSGEIFGIDTTTGEVWLLTKEADSWKKLGKPAGAQNGNIGSFMLAGVTADGATVMDSKNAYTWRVTIKDDKPRWVEISGPQSDKSWK